MATRYRRAVTLLEAELADEIVALDEARGLCFGLSPVASDVWRLLERPCTLEELVGKLRGRYDVDDATCRRDVEELLASLETEKLVAAERV